MIGLCIRLCKTFEFKFDLRSVKTLSTQCLFLLLLNSLGRNNILFSRKSTKMRVIKNTVRFMITAVVIEGSKNLYQLLLIVPWSRTCVFLIDSTRMTSLHLLLLHLHYSVDTISNALNLFRSSHHRCSIKIVVLKNFEEFIGKHLCHSLFFHSAIASTVLSSKA